MNLARTALHLFVISTSVVAAARARFQGAGAGAAPEAPLRYARIAGEGARVMNLADDKGKVILEPKKGTLLAIYKESEAGWVEVEVPGGFPVWVFGRYLQPSASEPGTYEVTGNAVNLRPEPSSDVTNFPLPQRLQAGDRVRGIEVAAADKPLEETWVRIWSPPGVRGYLRAGALSDLAAGEVGAELWARELASLPSAPPRASALRPSETPVERPEDEARASLEEARAALERERARETPDYASVRSALNAVVARAPTGAVAMEARAELRALESLEEAAALKADLERERARRQDEALRQQQLVWEKSRAKDPLGEVFLARGVLERRTGTDGIARFFLNFGGETACELQCSSGRYDLAIFAGVEVGVQGNEAPARTAGVTTYEVALLEVLAVR